jgi:hypothetical protein
MLKTQHSNFASNSHGCTKISIVNQQMTMFLGGSGGKEGEV